MEMALLSTLVTSHIRPVILSYSRATNISTAADFEFNLIQKLVNILLNEYSVGLWKRRLVLILLLDGSRLPPLLINNITVLTLSLLYKGTIGDELLW